MKLIVAIVQPEIVQPMQLALTRLGVRVMSVSQVLGGGKEAGYTEIYRGRRIHVSRPKVRLEIATNDGCAEAVIEAILRAGATGDADGLSDREVFVMDLAECVGVRNGGREPVAT